RAGHRDAGRAAHAELPLLQRIQPAARQGRPRASLRGRLAARPEAAARAHPVEEGPQPAPSRLPARSPLRLAHADNQSLLALDYEERRSELEAAANRLTHEVARYWSQSGDLRVDIDVEMAPIGGSHVAKYLQIRVEDLRNGFSNRFDQRSSGFRW